MPAAQAAAAAQAARAFAQSLLTSFSGPLLLCLAGGFLECRLAHSAAEEQEHRVEGETLVDGGGRMSSAFQVFD